MNIAIILKLLNAIIAFLTIFLNYYEDIEKW